MRNNINLTLLICALALSGCATNTPSRTVAVESGSPAPRLAPLPQDLQKEEDPNYRARLLNFFSVKPIEQISWPLDSTSASGSSK